VADFLALKPYTLYLKPRTVFSLPTTSPSSVHFVVRYALMTRTTDLHVHTLVSDGTRTPLEMLQAAKEAGVGRLSFCDHDALGAYRQWGDMFAHGKKLGVELVAASNSTPTT